MSPHRENAPPALHELESHVMDEIWSRGHATVRDVLEALSHFARVLDELGGEHVAEIRSLAEERPGTPR